MGAHRDLQAQHPRRAGPPGGGLGHWAVGDYQLLFPIWSPVETVRKEEAEPRQTNSLTHSLIH